MPIHFRVARPTDNLETVVKMYRQGLGMKLLGSFGDHEGFDGAMLGLPGTGYHLEFTHQEGHTVGLAPTKDNLLVFYVPDADEWRAKCASNKGGGTRPRRDIEDHGRCSMKVIISIPARTCRRGPRGICA